LRRRCATAREAQLAFQLWRKSGAIAAVRVNPLEADGLEDLAGIERPDVLMMSKVATPEQVQRLEAAAPPGVELVPNIESAAGLLRTAEIARARFLVECRAAGVEAVDCPYTFSDVKGAVADARYAKRLGYR
jgi:citrate lyase subunit beta / citryl-CoA lyase